MRDFQQHFYLHVIHEPCLYPSSNLLWSNYLSAYYNRRHWTDLVLRFWKKDELPEPEPEEKTEKKNSKMRLSNLRNPSAVNHRQKLQRFRVSQLSCTAFASTSRNTNSETALQLYSAARAKKIKIYSDREIQNASEMVKLYRVFWNNKANVFIPTRK